MYFVSSIILITLSIFLFLFAINCSFLFYLSYQAGHRAHPVFLFFQIVFMINRIKIMFVVKETIDQENAGICDNYIDERYCR